MPSTEKPKKLRGGLQLVPVRKKPKVEPNIARSYNDTMRASVHPILTGKDKK